MIGNYEIRITLLKVSDEHIEQLVNLLDVISELLEIAGGQVLFTVSPIEINDEEVEHEIEAALSKKAR